MPAALPPMAGQDLAAAVSRPERQWHAKTPRARVTVLDYGAKIAEGTASEITQDPDVVAAYLGQP